MKMRREREREKKEREREIYIPLPLMGKERGIMVVGVIFFLFFFAVYGASFGIWTFPRS